MKISYFFHQKNRYVSLSHQKARKQMKGDLLKYISLS